MAILKRTLKTTSTNNLSETLGLYQNILYQIDRYSHVEYLIDHSIVVSIKKEMGLISDELNNREDNLFV